MKHPMNLMLLANGMMHIGILNILTGVDWVKVTHYICINHVSHCVK